MFPLPVPIPYVTPITVGEPKTSGRTQPFQMRCENNGEQADYIVKLWANPEVYLGKHNLAREVYGSLLARSFGLDTPDISIVEIEPDFYTSQPQDKAPLIRKSIGYNFGSKLVRGATIFSPPLPASRHSDAVKVFCFDMLICNPDRRIDKPNVFHTSNGFMVFDHEQAFPFSRPQMMLGGYPSCWEYIKEKWHKNHIFFPYIRNHDCLLEIEEFVENLVLLSGEILDTIEGNIPEDWYTGSDIRNIRLYLANTRDNANLFKRSLQEILT
jgi:hypothetical protein